MKVVILAACFATVADRRQTTSMFGANVERKKMLLKKGTESGKKRWYTACPKEVAESERSMKGISNVMDLRK